MLPHEKKSETALLCFALFALCATVVWVRTATVKDTYRYVQQEKELYRLEQETQAIRMQWLQLTAPKRLEALARTLELAPPRRQQILRYDAAVSTVTRNP